MLCALLLLWLRFEEQNEGGVDAGGWREARELG